MPATRLSRDGRSRHRMQHSARLERSTYIVALVLLYASAAVVSWALKCIASYRPIGGMGYGYRLGPLRDAETAPFSRLTVDTPEVMKWNRRLIKMAGVLQSMVTVGTIPLITAVCSQAAVVYLQRTGRTARRPTLRQAMALADKSWTTPQLLFKLAFQAKSRVLYGSWFLWCAIGLVVLGVSLNPLQTALTSPQTIAVPTRLHQVDQQQADIPQRFDENTGADDGYTVAMTRSRLATAKNTDTQMRLWSSNPVCNGTDDETHVSESCRTPGSQYTLGGMHKLDGPFWSQLPAGYNTGLLEQFAPWIRSTTTRENITAEEFDRGCDDREKSLILRYHNFTSEIEFDFELCMPGNVTSSPWKARRTQQEFHEHVLLRANLSATSRTSPFIPGIYAYNLSLSTAAGYFTLPNSTNNYVDLSLMDPHENPVDRCKDSPTCATQDKSKRANHLPRNMSMPATASFDITAIGESPNKGPLLTIVLALFGPGSFFNSSRQGHGDGDGGLHQCAEVLPMTHLFRQDDASQGEMSSLDPCIKRTEEDRTIPLQAEYIWSFFHNDFGQQRITEAFNAAAFLAHDVVMMCNPASSTWEVSYDPGKNIVIPHVQLDTWQFWFLSTHLFAYLACLLTMALYSAATRRWVRQLDSLAMMQIGASIADRISLQLVPDVEDIDILDKCGGWIGDGTEADEIVEGLDPHGKTTVRPATLGLGAERALNFDRKYCSYPFTKSRWYRWLRTGRGGHGDMKAVNRDEEEVPLRPLWPGGRPST